MKLATLLVLHSDCFTLHEALPVLRSAIGLVNRRAIIRLEGISQKKILKNTSGIEPATFLLLTQCRNQMCHRVYWRKPNEMRC